MIQAIGKPPILASGISVPLTPAIRAGDFIFVSGQLGIDDRGTIIADDIGAQVHQEMRNIRAIIAQAGLGLSTLVKVSVWLTDKAARKSTRLNSSHECASRKQ